MYPRLSYVGEHGCHDGSCGNGYGSLSEVFVNTLQFKVTKTTGSPSVLCGLLDIILNHILNTGCSILQEKVWHLQLLRSIPCWGHMHR